MAADPGSCMPNASASEFMVVAVPIVLQYPVEGADDATRSINPSSSISPVASSSRAFHTIVPEPVLCPLKYQFSIGPTDNAIAGILTVAAAISRAGVVLSQPIFRTMPSIGYPKRLSTKDRYARFLSNIAVGLLPVSCIGCTGISITVPPAA